MLFQEVSIAYNVSNMVTKPYHRYNANRVEAIPMRKKTILKAFFASLPLLALGAALCLSVPHSSAPGGRVFSSYRRTNDAPSYDFSGATEAQDISVKIIGSSESSLGQFLEISFSTGGTSYKENSNAYRIACSDPEFTDYLENTFNNYSTEDKAQIEAQYEAGEYAPRLFDGYVQSVNPSINKVADLVIPKCLYRGCFWGIRPVEIVDTLLADWSKMAYTSVYIPETITHISEKAFRGIDSSKVTFYLEQAAIPDEWEEGWHHGCAVQTGFDYNTEFKFDKGSRATSKCLPQNTGTEQFGDENENYYLGYYTEENNYPLVAQYHLVGEADTAPYHYHEFSKKAENSDYDAVGGGITSFSTSLFCDIPLGDGEKLDVESLLIQNIMPATDSQTDICLGDGASKEFELSRPGIIALTVKIDDVEIEKSAYTYEQSGKITFNTAPGVGATIEVTYRTPWTPKSDELLYAEPAVSFSHNYDLGDFVSTKFVGISTLGDFTMVRMQMDLANIEEVYKLLKNSLYNANKSQLDSKAIYVRARLTSISLSSLQFLYEKNGEMKQIETTLSSPISQIILSQGENAISFLVKNSELSPDFDVAAIRQVNLLSLYITVDLFASNGSVARSAASTRFGIVSVMPHQTSAPATFNVSLFLVLEALIYLVVFAAGTVALFFYRKAKYKNDEFLRVKPKKFFLHALLALVCAYFVVLAITSIILRTGVFANAVVVFNPLDAFIIVFGILSILVIGYFGKYLVGAIKARNERNRIRRLKLNEDVPDDGTNI